MIDIDTGVNNGSSLSCAARGESGGRSNFGKNVRRRSKSARALSEVTAAEVREENRDGCAPMPTVERFARDVYVHTHTYTYARVRTCLSIR